MAPSQASSNAQGFEQSQPSTHYQQQYLQTIQREEAISRQTLIKQRLFPVAESSLKSSIDTSPATGGSSKGSVPLGSESPIKMLSNASWRCKFCSNTYSIEHSGINRPLGYFRCPTCGCCPHFEIHNVPGLQQLSGIEYAVYTPQSTDNSTSVPHSVFLWVCCTCGRSWPQTPTPQRQSLSTSQKAHPDRGRLFKRLIHQCNEPPPRNILVSSDARAGHATYIVTFGRRCICTHDTCKTCFRAMVLAEGESFSRRLQAGETVKVSPERLANKIDELRGM